MEDITGDGDGSNYLELRIGLPDSHPLIMLGG